MPFAKAEVSNDVAAASSTPSSQASPQAVEPSVSQKTAVEVRPPLEKASSIPTTSVVICQNQPEPFWNKVFTEAPSVLFGFAALIISIVSFFYTRNNDKRSRAQSIHDDYWIRKIISPISVEPFLKYTTELSASLPNGKSTPAQVQDYWREQVLKVGEFSLSFRVLNLVDQQLAINTAHQLEQFEDCIAEYCGKLRQHLEGHLLRPPNRDECARKLIETTIEILKLIQQHQASVGETSGPQRR
jgi:hypothetical protein